MTSSSAPHRTHVDLGAPSRMIDRLREGAAVIYLEGSYDPRSSAPTAEWTADNLKLGGGITTSRVNSSHTVTVSTIVLLDPLMYANVMRLKPSLEFCLEDRPGSYKLCHPDTEEGQGGQWMPLVRVPQHASPSPSFYGWPPYQGIWRVVLNVTAIDPRGVEYLNGDRFDLRASNLRLIDV